MTEREALKLALEALEDLGMKHYESTGEVLYKDTFTAIKEALAQPEPWEKFCDSYCVWTDHHPDCKLAEQEPVAWRYKILDYFGRPVWTLKTPKTDIRVLESQPLYTTPPQRKPLSDEQIILIVAECAASHQHTDIHFARAIEAKLKEKNT